ncbi:hypothetical protein SLS60_011455 [Paraconiothyrium brasiliense]|uniref:Zinc finger PHD-type domain-containing protein n=1 Tax=Paraconiothyrium brasiliense TaxID=300254 RepID=A0ABR3QJN7_9PLEO
MSYRIRLRPDHPCTIQTTAAANGTKAWYHQLNVTEADAVPPVFDTIREQIRHPLRGLVACTGISGVSDATSYPIDAFRKIIDVNIAGTFLMAQAVGKELHRANLAGMTEGINSAAYNTSKSAVHQLARSLAGEWGHPQNTFAYYPAGHPEREVYPPIRVNTISPGHIETALTKEAQATGLVDDWAKQNMLGRVSQVEEYRAAVLFLLGDGSSYMTGANQQLTESPPSPRNFPEPTGSHATGAMSAWSPAWTSTSSPANSGPSSNSTTNVILSNAETTPVADLNNQMHVDTSADKVYHTSVTHYAGHYTSATEGQQAMRAMRHHLETLLPRELIQDEFGNPVAIEQVSSQHLAKLQGKVWRELPQKIATASISVDGEITDEFIITAHSVRYLAKLLSDNNTVFVLQRRSMQPCHSALCRHVHERLEQPYSEEEVTFEPLVDWMTLDPVLDVTPLWFTLYRRNKSLLHKFALANTRFVPRNPVRFCLECLLFIANERNEVWYIMKQDPDVIYADVPPPWPLTKTDDDSSEEDLPSESDSSISEKSITPLRPAVAGESMVPYVDGTFNFRGQPRSNKFHIWRDPIFDQEYKSYTPASQLTLSSVKQTYNDTPQESQSTRVAGWTSINALAAVKTPSSNDPVQSPAKEQNAFSFMRYRMDSPGGVPSQDTFALSEEEKYSAARAGFPLGPAHEYRHKPDICFEAAPVAYYGPIRSERPVTHSGYDSQTKADGSTNTVDYDGYERNFGDELDCNLNTISQVSSSPSIQLPANTEATEPLTNVEAPASQTPHNTVSHGNYTWPAPKDSTSPVPARPTPGCGIITTSDYPHPSQVICWCKRPAKTGTVRIVQCRNSECSVRWYHYACLKDAREKRVARFGTLLCEICKGENYWGKAEGMSDLSMPFTREEVMNGISGMTNASGASDPYGLGKIKHEDDQREWNGRKAPMEAEVRNQTRD